MPTNSGLHGPNINAMREESIPRPPNQGREGPGQGSKGPARWRRTSDRKRLPDHVTSQDQLPKGHRPPDGLRRDLGSDNNNIEPSTQDVGG